MKLQDIEIIKKIKKEVVLATIINTKGSSPRDDARMVVSDQTTIGTIGGGELEFRIIRESKELLQKTEKIEKIISLPLGPSLGQCCGGYVEVKIKKFLSGEQLLEKHDLKNEILDCNDNLYIFGAGHVCKALISKIDGVGFNIFVIDSRKSLISKLNEKFVTPILAIEPSILIKSLPSNGFYLVMTHSHQIDLSICSDILKKNNFQFLGLIGSKTKKAKFEKKLQELGHAKTLISKIICPIGLDEIPGKEPDIIAISTIAQLLKFKKTAIYKTKDNIRLIKG